MSIASRKRNPKAPTQYSRRLYPGPDRGFIPMRAIGKFRPAASTLDSHKFEPHGKFGGVTKVMRAFLRMFRGDKPSAPDSL